MSYNTRVTRSKGESDRLSLPAKTRPKRKPTNMENDDGNTVLNTTLIQAQINTTHRCLYIHPHSDANPHHLKLTQSGCGKPVPAVPATSHRPLTPHIPLPKSQNSSSSSSQMSAPLFVEDRYSSSSDDDAEITLINR